MSELLPGIAWDPPPARIRDAAAVILLRGPEVFWVRRGEKVTFSGGFYAFPGGKVDAADAKVPIARCPPGEEALRVCAVRETFEEAGVLLVRDPPPPDRLEALRRELLAGGSFGAMLEREGLALDASLLVPAGRWLTPPFSPVRFDARFYLAVAPEAARAHVIPGELSDGGFVEPRHALARWEAGTALLHPPNHHAMATLAGRTPEDAVPLLRSPPFVRDLVVERLEFQRGILTVPLRTATLPPATHTNAYVIGTGELLIVDPGASDPAELAHLERIVRELVDEGRRVRAVALTHHHADHVGGARELARRLDVPLWASEGAARRVEGAEAVLRHHDRIELAGPRAFSLRCLLTEGHADGHLCFLDEATRAVICGDMVASGSTIVIDPPEGHMGRYLASLRALREVAGTLYPAHGFPIPDGPAKLDEYLSHREMRIEAIAATLERGEVDLPGLVAHVYADTPAPLHPVAERSALASLEELARRGRAREIRPGVWAI